MVPLRRFFPELTVRAEVYLLACFLGFIALTTWFTAFEVAQSEHRWCDVVNTVAAAPVPKGAPPANVRLLQDFRRLKEEFGC